MDIDATSKVIAFCLFVYFIICFFKGFITCKSPYTFSDNFDLGYVKSNQKNISARIPVKKIIYHHNDKQEVNNLEKEIIFLKKQINNLLLKQNKNNDSGTKTKQRQVKTNDYKSPQQKPEPQIQEQPKEQNLTSNIIIEECIQALITLGYKNKSAKQEVQKFLTNNKVETAEQFVVDFFKRGGKND